MTSNTGDFGQENPSKSQIHPQLHPPPHHPFSPGAAGAPRSGKLPLKKRKKNPKTKPEGKNGGKKEKKETAPAPRRVRRVRGCNGGTKAAPRGRPGASSARHRRVPRALTRPRFVLPAGAAGAAGLGGRSEPPGSLRQPQVEDVPHREGRGQHLPGAGGARVPQDGGYPDPSSDPPVPSRPPGGGGFPGFVGSRRRRRRRDSPGRALPAARDAPAPHALPPERRGRSSPFPARFQNKASGKEPREGGRGCRALG